MPRRKPPTPEQRIKAAVAPELVAIRDQITLLWRRLESISLLIEIVAGPRGRPRKPQPKRRSETPDTTPGG